MQISPIVKTRSTEYYVLVHCHEKEPHSHHEPRYFVSTFLSCLNHENVRVCAEIGGDFFYVYEEGKREKCSRCDTLNFLGCNGDKYVARVKNNLFHIIKKADADVTCGSLSACPCDDQMRPTILYLDWDRIPTVTSIAKWEIG